MPLGNLLFKAGGVALALPLVTLVASGLEGAHGNVATSVVLFHFGLNVVVAMAFMGVTRHVAALVERWLPQAVVAGALGQRKRASAKTNASRKPGCVK